MIRLTISKESGRGWTYQPRHKGKWVTHNNYGPAICTNDGAIYYFRYQTLHRLTGPAVIIDDRVKKLFIDGVEYDNYLEYSVAAENYRNNC